MKIVLLGCLLLFAPRFAQAEVYSDDCANLVGSCEYYACIDQNRLSCGEQGYSLGYGQKYCEKFSSIDFPETATTFWGEVFPSNGNLWRDNVRSCLQANLESWYATASKKDCSTLRTFAFNSHPDCYTTGPSFCELIPDNVLRIGLKIQINDLFKAETLRQIQATSRICVAQLDERISQEIRAPIRFQLVEFRKIWVLVAADPKLLGRLFAIVPR
jgi:hypothetical protein